MVLINGPGWGDGDTGWDEFRKNVGRVMETGNRYGWGMTWDDRNLLDLV